MIINSRKENGITVFDIFEHENVDDLELICGILAKNYTLEVDNKLEGPGATIWEIKMDGHGFQLINNSYGNVLKPQDAVSEIFMEQEIPLLKLL